MSGLGQTRRSTSIRAMSAYPAIADELLERAIRRFGPTGDIQANAIRPIGAVEMAT